MTDQRTTNPEATEETITRKTVLKRVGVGVAVAWGAPLFVSTQGAGARTIRPICPSPTCGNGRAHTGCAGFFKAKKSTTTFCGNCGPCTHVKLSPCSTDSHCPNGWKCAFTCCSVQTYCVPPCGHKYFPGAPSSGHGTSCL